MEEAHETRCMNMKHKPNKSPCGKRKVFFAAAAALHKHQTGHGLQRMNPNDLGLSSRETISSTCTHEIFKLNGQIAVKYADHIAQRMNTFSVMTP